MIYAVVNELDQVLREASHHPPLTPQELDKGRLPNGKLSMRRLVMANPPIDEACHRYGIPAYEVQNDKVLKVRPVIALTEDEKKQRKTGSALECRRSVLPPREETFELLAAGLVEVMGVLAMMENPKDPRTKISESFKSIKAQLESLVALCAANPVKE